MRWRADANINDDSEEKSVNLAGSFWDDIMVETHWS